MQSVLHDADISKRSRRIRLGVNDWLRLIWSCEGHLPTRARGVFAVLAVYADPDGRNARPSLETIAIAQGIGRSTARRGLSDLHELGIIEGQPDERRGATTTWALNAERLLDFVDPDSRFLTTSLSRLVEYGEVPRR